jgi:uncharacterized protein (TIGR03086 family)
VRGLVGRVAEGDDADVTPSTDTVGLLVLANDEFARTLRLVGADDWPRPTPCSEWDVRALVNHVVGGCVRHRMLLQGAQTHEVEATRAVDHLGANPAAAFAAAADAVVACFCQDGALERIVPHAAGDRPGRELLSMRVLDSAVHSRDLARATGRDETLDDEVVAFLLAYTAGLDLGPEQRAFAPAVADPPRNASPQDQLLHRLGRHPNVTEEVP